MTPSSGGRALADALRELYVGGRTGRLTFTGGRARRSALFWKGRVVHAASEANDEHLGEFMVAKGWLSHDVLAQATKRVTTERRRLGMVLVDMGALDGERLEEAVAEHVRHVFTRALDESALQFQFAPLDAESPLEEDVSSRIATGDLILEAVESVSDDVVHESLGDGSRVLVLSNDPLLRFQRIALSPVDGYALSRIDGTLSVSELLQLIPMVPTEVERSLYRLLCAGIVEFAAEVPAAKPQPPAPRARPEAPPAASPPAPPPPAARPAPPPPPRSVSAPAASAAPAPGAAATPRGSAAPPPSPDSATGPAAPARGLGAQRRAIEEMHASLSAKNHFEVLELTRKSDAGQVKEAYFRLAKEFHPDRFSDPRFADLRPKVEAVFVRLGQAYDVLRDAERRGRYESDLAARQPWRPAPTPAPVEPPAAPVPDPDAAANEAEEAVKRARKLVKLEKFWDAIQLLERAVEDARGVWLIHANMLLAECYLRNPNWIKRAEEQLLRVIELDPKHVEAHFQLGRLYRDKGMNARAAAMLSRAVELNPDHEDAGRLLAKVQPAETLTQTPPRSFFKKLFGG